MNTDPTLETLITETATTLGSGFSINEQVDESLTEQQQQQEPTPPATPTPSNTKPRLISPELIAEKFEQKKLNENRLREWIASIRNQTDF
ncbi:hypothetical protein ACRTDM_17010 [Shewanella algae]|uniref:hypothetical protein n=1 Tax=Shewanella algae TaxID=38313 RepID=UPI003D7E7FA9